MTDYTNWHVGMKVECVDDRPRKGNPQMDGLTTGCTYTILRIGIDAHWGDLCVWLEEIRRPIEPGYERWGEIGYAIDRFRPVQPRKTSIAMLERFLTDPKARIEENA